MTSQTYLSYVKDVKSIVKRDLTKAEYSKIMQAYLKRNTPEDTAKEINQCS